MGSEKMTMSDEQLVAKEIDDIPIELLRDDIFARLPVKTLLRIRCVCKLWCSIIDSQNFMRIRKSPHLFYIDSKDHNWSGQYVVLRITLRSIDTFEIIDQICTINGNYTYFIGSCNGLMLMYHCDMSILRIWNPSIQKSLLLPSCPFEIHPIFQLESFLLGYPSSDNGNNNFKVAAFQRHPLRGEAYNVTMTIYSSRSHRWNSIIRRNDALVPPPPNYRVFYQGAWYWLTNTHLLSFDFDSEDFISVELPVDKMQGVVTRFIFLLCKKLAVLSVSSKSFCVWVMDKDKDSKKKSPWRPWLSRDSTHEELVATCGRLSDLYSRIFYNERDSDTFIFQTFDKVFSYTFSTQQVQNLRMIPPYNNFEVFLDDYAESLVLHKGTGGHILTSYPS